MVNLEIWKDISGFEGLYKISSEGRILSIGNSASKKDKFLKHWNCVGYPAVDLRKNKKAYKFLVHRLVALHFIANPNNLPIVNHKDHDKTNYSIANLEWCTNEDNVLHGKRKGKTVENIRMRSLVADTRKYIMKHNLDVDIFIAELTKS